MRNGAYLTNTLTNNDRLRRFSHQWINYTRQWLKRLTDAYISLQDYIQE